MDRFTSMGISNSAQEFLDAAKIVRSRQPAIYNPSFFLACQSIELSLKAYLRGSGFGKNQLKAINHNLEKCVEEARCEGVDNHVSLSEAEAAIIAVVNPYYQYKAFQYSTTGYKSLPQIASLIDLAERVLEALRPFCIEHREYHYRKPTAIV